MLRYHHRHRYRRVGQLAPAEGELQRPCSTSSTPPLQSLVSWLRWRSERHHPSHEKGRREMLLQLHDSCEAPCERPLPLALRATVAEHWVDAPMIGWWVWCWPRWNSSSTRGARQRVCQHRMDPKGWWRATRRALQHHPLPSHRHHHVHGACPQPLVGPPSFRVPSCRRLVLATARLSSQRSPEPGGNAALGGCLSVAHAGVGTPHSVRASGHVSQIGGRPVAKRVDSRGSQVRCSHQRRTTAPGIIQQLTGAQRQGSPFNAPAAAPQLFMLSKLNV